VDVSSAPEHDRKPTGKSVIGRFEEMHAEIKQMNQDAKLITLTQKLNYKEKRIQSLENELSKIYGTRSWKFLRAYARLKSLFRTNPRVALKRTLQKIQMDGIFVTIMQGGTYLLVKSKVDALHNPLKLPLPGDYKAYLSAHLPCLHQLLSQRQEILTWENRPLISLIMPVYNTHVQWLKNLLSSVSNQTYDRWGAILVDDRSTSFQTVALLREQVKKDPRFKLIERYENRGVLEIKRPPPDWVVAWLSWM